MNRTMLTLAMSLLTACAALADEAKLTFAGDTFAAGQSSSAGTEVQRDAFVAGFDVKLGGTVGGDAHMAGFNVDANSPVGGDLYAAGFNVKVAQPVGGDLTAVGNDVTVESGATIGGNARLSGAQVTVAGQITGAALIAADTLMLNTPVQGDFEFFGKKIEFGPKALLAGTVSVHAPAPIDIPASVASADRIRFEALETTDYAGEAGKTAEHVVRGVWPAVWAVGVWWASLAVVGTLIIALLPRAASALENKARSRSWATIGLGLVGFAAVLGMVLQSKPAVCAALICTLPMESSRATGCPSFRDTRRSVASSRRPPMSWLSGQEIASGFRGLPQPVVIAHSALRNVRTSVTRQSSPATTSMVDTRNIWSHAPIIVFRCPGARILLKWRPFSAQG